MRNKRVLHVICQDVKNNLHYYILIAVKIICILSIAFEYVLYTVSIRQMNTSENREILDLVCILQLYG